MKKTLTLTAITLTAMLTLTGCNWQGEMQDLEGIDFVDPDQTTAWNNVNGHPNIVRVCLDGVAFATTTREYGDAITRIPEWDTHCPRN